MTRAGPAPGMVYEITPRTPPFQEGQEGSDQLTEPPGLQLGSYRYFIGHRNGEPVLLRCLESESRYLSEVVDHELLGITEHDIMVAVRECPDHIESDAIPVSDHVNRKLQILFR